MLRIWVTSLMVGCALLGAATAQGVSRPLCRPSLTITDAAFSPMQPPSLERRWSATVRVDASRCTTTAGRFSIGFLRIKEDGGEAEFREPFSWSLPAVRVLVWLWADEAVQAAWIDATEPCPCRDGGAPP